MQGDAFLLFRGMQGDAASAPRGMQLGFPGGM